MNEDLQFSFVNKLVEAICSIQEAHIEGVVGIISNR